VSSRKSALPISLAMEMLTCLAPCRERLKEAAEQLRQSPDDEDASRVAQETTDYLTHWIKSFQVTARCRLCRRTASV
jgi:hypothetical protein